MYYFAGALTITWGILLYFILPPDPVRAKGFSERERYILVARVRSNNSGLRNKHFKVEQVREALVDVKFWLLFAIAFLSMIANGPISTFVPLLIQGFGFSTLHSLLLVMPAGAFAGTMMLVLSYLACKFPGWRCWLVALAQLGTSLAALLLWNLPSSAKGGLLFACYVLPSVGAGYSVLMGLQIANTAGYTKRSLTSSGLFVGYCLGKLLSRYATFFVLYQLPGTLVRWQSLSSILGGVCTNLSSRGNIVGPLVYTKQDAPRYIPGFIVVVITALLAGVLVVVYRFVCIWDNKKRDEVGIMEGFDHAYEDDLTDKKVSLPAR